MFNISLDAAFFYGELLAPGPTPKPEDQQINYL